MLLQSVSALAADVSWWDDIRGLGPGMKTVQAAAAKQIALMRFAGEEEEEGEGPGWTAHRRLSGAGCSSPDEIHPADRAHGNMCMSGKSDEEIMCPVYMLRAQ